MTETTYPRQHSKVFVRVAAALLLASLLVAGCGEGGPGNAEGPSGPTESEPSMQETTAMDEGVVFRDDFSDPSSGWSEGENEFGTFEYVDGAYRITAPEGGKGAASDTSFQGDAARDDLTRLGDVSVEVDVKKEGKVQVPGIMAVACRANPDPESAGNPRYQANIDTDGYWGIYKSEDGQAKPLKQAENPSQFSDAIAPRDEINRIRLDCLGGTDGGPATVALYVNGEKVAEAEDPKSIPPGAVTLIVETLPDQQGEQQASFDNLIIREP